MLQEILKLPNKTIIDRLNDNLSTGPVGKRPFLNLARFFNFITKGNAMKQYLKMLLSDMLAVLLCFGVM